MPPLPGTETILVVDDEIVVLSLTSAMLRRYGYEVLTAASGTEALHLFDVWPDLEIDLLLVDILMPDMNGVQLAEHIQLRRPALPVLFFSAYSDRAELRPLHARKLPYISKPFTSIQLTKKIREVLDKPQTASTGQNSS